MLHLQQFPPTAYLTTDMPNHGSPSALQRAHVHSPVTALAFFSTASPPTPRTYVLSGEDTHLHIRDAATSVLCASLEVFPAQPVHGIAVSSCAGNVLIWGASSVTALPRSTIESLIRGDSSSVALDVLQAPDWVYHGAISDGASPSFSSPSRSVLVTAHNEILPLQVHPSADGVSSPRLKFGKLRAPRTSRPILYAAQVRWTSEDEVLVAAGTVFGEIIVWRCRGLDHHSEESHQGVQVLFVFTGHEGSIFGLDISPTIFVPDEDSAEKEAGKRMRLLASCSDDRTIRIWDICSDTTPTAQDDHILVNEKKQEGRETGPPRRHFTEARETGFGENVLPSLEAAASHVSSKPLAMAMGHVSRIWDVRFATTSTQEGAAKESLTLYSFGEDATAQKWRLDLAGDTLLGGEQQDAAGGRATLSHQAIMLRHSGKHIWSSAILGSPDGGNNNNNKTRTLIATGGSDGKINLVEDVEGGYPGSVMLTVSGSEVCGRFPSSPPRVVAQDQNQNQEAEQEQRTSSAPTAPKKQKKKTKEGTTSEQEPFQMYAILSSTSFLATTPTGRIFKGSLLSASSSSTIEWEEIHLEQDIRNDLRQYQIVRGLIAKAHATGTALLASITGKLYLYSDSDRSVRQIYQMPGKIADVFPLPFSTDALPPGLLGNASNTAVPVIVTTMGNPQLTRLLLLELSSEGGAAAICQEHTIELDKGFIATAAGCCRGYFVLGSRSGALAVYKTTRDGKGGTRLHFEQITRVDRPLTKDAVSTIVALPPNKKNSPPSSSSCPYFLTTSRDGRYRIYELVHTTASRVEAQLRHEAVPPLGPYIEGAFFTANTDTPELILSGFRSQDFVVWNETRQVEVAKVECGGAFRSFTYHVGGDANRDIIFVWTRAARTCVYSYSSAPHLQRWAELPPGDARTNPDANAAGITTLKPGGHGREIKAAAAWGDLLATGAEDTTLRIWRVSSSTNNNRNQAASPSLQEAAGHPSSSSSAAAITTNCLAVVQKHTTGIQHLQWVVSQGREEKDTYLVSSSGNEELFLWRVSTLLASGYDGLAVVCEAAYGDKTRDGDLRIMGFDVQQVSGRLGNNNQEEEEEEVHLVLSLVLSNSTLRTYSYSKTSGFSLFAEGRYTGACLLQIRHLHLGSPLSDTTTAAATTAAEMHVLTTSTDGHIALWKTTVPTISSSSLPSPKNNKKSEYVLADAFPLHQSSIKSLDVHPLPPPPHSPAAAHHHPSPPPSSYLLITGGDDNALGITHLTPSASSSSLPGPGPDESLVSSPPSPSSYQIASRTLVNAAHAAAITGLAIASIRVVVPPDNRHPPSATTTTAHVCTTSTDQRVKSWRIVLTITGGGVVGKEAAAGTAAAAAAVVVQPKVALVADRYSAVADCGDVAWIQGEGGDVVGQDGRLVVAGVGLEVWRGEDQGK